MREQIFFAPFEEPDIRSIKKYFCNRSIMNLNGIAFRYFSENQLLELLENVNERKHPILLVRNPDQQGEGIGMVIFEKQKPMATGVCCRILLWAGEHYDIDFVYIVKTLLGYVFNDLNLNRISIYVPYLKISLIEKLSELGFEREFVGREAYYSNGAFRDIIRVGLLRKEELYV